MPAMLARLAEKGSDNSSKNCYTLNLNMIEVIFCFWGGGGLGMDSSFIYHKDLLNPIAYRLVEAFT